MTIWKMPKDVHDSILLKQSMIEAIYSSLQVPLPPEYLKNDFQKEKQMSLNVSDLLNDYQPITKVKLMGENISNITGNCLLGKNQNDNKKSLVKVTDLQEIKAYQKKSFDYILDQIEDPNIKGFIANQCYLAGGCIRNFIMGIPVKDLDIYFRTEKGASFFRDLWIKRKYSSKKIFKKDISCVADTYNALTFKDIEARPEVAIPFQFVIKTGGTPEKVVFETFDFQNCMGWYDPIKDELDISVMLNSLDKSELIYNSKTTDPLNSIRRLVKFQKMGFEITERCLFDMFKQSKERTVDEQFKRYKFGREANY